MGSMEGAGRGYTVKGSSESRGMGSPQRTIPRSVFEPHRRCCRLVSRRFDATQSGSIMWTVRGQFDGCSD